MFMLSLIAAYGITFGLMNDKAKLITDLLVAIPLFKDSNEKTFFARMFVCSYCTGFHAGWMVYLIENFEKATLSYGFFSALLVFSFASSIFCYSVDTVLQWFER